MNIRQKNFGERAWGRREPGSNNSRSDYQYGRRYHDPTSQEREIIARCHSGLFNKKKQLKSYVIDSYECCKHMFLNGLWMVPALQMQKQQLNDVRNKLNLKDIKLWKQHTKITNMTSHVVSELRYGNGIEMCTNAWVKMFEIHANYQLIKHTNDQYRTLHVCEAPGAFVCSTNYFYQKFCKDNFMRMNWDWMATTYNEIDNDQATYDIEFIKDTLPRWNFGADNTGDILKVHNIKYLWQKNGKVDLVTGDGSIGVGDGYNEQESMVSNLLYAETICALGALNFGGSLVLKMFNLFECDTIGLLYLLATHFRCVNFFKPSCSRAPNAEVYIIAEGYNGIHSTTLDLLLNNLENNSDKVLFGLDSIPSAFINEIIEISQFFVDKQIQAIQRNLDLEEIWNPIVNRAVMDLGQNVSRQFRQIYHIYKGEKQIAPLSRRRRDGTTKQN